MFFLLPIFCFNFFLIYHFVTAKTALPKKSLVFAARQIANNLSPIAKKLWLHFLAFCKISLERTSNNLVCALQCFLCLFWAHFALLKTVLSNRNLTKKGLKIESFLQKTQTFFCVFFLRPSSKVTNFNTPPMPLPPFENFSLNTLNSEEKSSVKKPVDRAGQKPVNRPVDRPVNRRWFWNLPVGLGRENPDRFHLWFEYWRNFCDFKNRNIFTIRKGLIKHASQ